MLRIDKGSPKHKANPDPPPSPKVIRRTMSGSKGYANKRPWLRDLLVVATLGAVYYFLATRMTPPAHSPLSRAGPPVTVAKEKRGALQEVTLGHQRAFATLPSTSASAAAAANLGGGGSAAHLRDRNATQPGHLDRRAGAVLGLFVADAAAMGLHWIYDTHKIQQLVGTGSPEFHEPPAGPFYHYESGDLSPYGYESLLVLRSAARVGAVDGPELQKDLVEGFSSYTGRLNRASKELLEHAKGGCQYPACGSSAVDPHGVLKVAIVAAMYAGTPHLEERVRDAVLAHQTGEMVLDAALDTAKLLSHVITHGTVSAAMDWGFEDPAHLSASGHSMLEKARRARHTPHIGAVKRFGQKCELPGSLESVLHAAMSSQGYAEAIRKTILAGGDNCSRAGVLGALFGAQEGEAGIPSDWKAKVTRYPEIQALVQQILDLTPV